MSEAGKDGRSETKNSLYLISYIYMNKQCDFRPVILQGINLIFETNQTKQFMFVLKWKAKNVAFLSHRRFHFAHGAVRNAHENILSFSALPFARSQSSEKCQKDLCDCLLWSVTIFQRRIDNILRGNLVRSIMQRFCLHTHIWLWCVTLEHM